LVVVYVMLKVIHIVETLLTVISYRQLLKFQNKLFLFKGKFGNRPVSPTIRNVEAKIIPIQDRSRTFLSIDNSLSLDYMYRKMYAYN
jgi:hypothetical protein